MFYTIYKVTNQVNGKVYIGSHKTNNLNDGYMGSGKYLLHAIKKYGVEHFQKEILFVFDNKDEMFAKEAELVNEEFLAEENTYNLKKGGFGGFDYINTQLYEKVQQVRSQNAKKIPLESKRSLNSRLNGSRNIKAAWAAGKITVPSWKGRTHSDESKKKISSTMKGRVPWNKGKKHSEETKEKIRKSVKETIQTKK